MRKLWIFFYGSFMNPNVLAKADVQPTDSQRARLDGWDIKIAPRATLVPSDQSRVYGVLARVTHPDLEKLYTKDWFGFGTYLPEAVLVADSAERFVPALSYIAWEMEGGTPSIEYIDNVVDAALQFEFRTWYVNRIKSFSSGT
jgi:Gamma-glutamyl cyclotransferase, AIG2-like